MIKIPYKKGMSYEEGLKLKLKYIQEEKKRILSKLKECNDYEMTAGLQGTNKMLSREFIRTKTDLEAYYEATTAST